MVFISGRNQLFFSVGLLKIVYSAGIYNWVSFTLVIFDGEEGE